MMEALGLRTMQELNEIKRRIRENEGTILWAIHPYYRTIAGLAGPQIQKVIKRVEGYVSNANEKSPVLLISEEYTDVRTTKERLSKLSSGATFCVVPTDINSGIPRFTYENERGKRKTATFDVFASMLKTLGVKEIFFGGLYFNRLPGDIYFGCAASTFSAMKDHHFDVKLTGFSWPYGGKTAQRHINHKTSPEGRNLETS